MERISRIISLGDSHSEQPWRYLKHPYFEFLQVHLGPKLMHSVGRDKLNLTDAWQVPVSSRLKDLLITPEDHLVFCFGEIDCRCQLWKFRDKNLLVIIHDLVDSYLEGIYQLVNELPNLPASIWINCVPPASRILTSTVKGGRS